MANKKSAVIGLGLAAVLCVSLSAKGMYAYFTDTESEVNTFTLGNVNIDLQEPNWEDGTDENDNGIPDEAENIVPAKEIPKDPKIENTGKNDAYVFLAVDVPVKNVITAKADGTRNPVADTEMFYYHINSGWTQVSAEDTTDTEGGKVKRYLYAYGTEEACTTLKAGSSTGTLFDTVTFANVIEGQGLEDATLTMPVKAYAIQADNVSGGINTPKEVWAVYANQNGL